MQLNFVSTFITFLQCEAWLAQQCSGQKRADTFTIWEERTSPCCSYKWGSFSAEAFLAELSWKPCSQVKMHLPFCMVSLSFVAYPTKTWSVKVGCFFMEQYPTGESQNDVDRRGPREKISPKPHSRQVTPKLLPNSCAGLYSLPLAVSCQEESGSIFYFLPPGSCRSPGSRPSTGWASPALSASPGALRAPASNHLDWTWATISMSILYLRVQNWTWYHQCGLTHAG